MNPELGVVWSVASGSVTSREYLSAWGGGGRESMLYGLNGPVISDFHKAKVS